LWVGRSRANKQYFIFGPNASSIINKLNAPIFCGH